MGNFRNFAVWVIIAMLLFALFNLFQQPGGSTRADPLTYSEFIAKVEAGTVRDVTIAGEQITGKLNDGKAFETFAPNDPNLVTTLSEKGVNISAQAANSDGAFPGMLLSWFRSC